MEKKKISIITAMILALLGIILVGGVTYAFFSYIRTGNTNTINVGRIAFKTTEDGNINLTNNFPVSSADELEEGDNQTVITITGDTTYEHGVEYLVSIGEANIEVGEKTLPISLEIVASNLGTENENYFAERETTDTSIYKVLAEDTVYSDERLVVGYIAPGETGINGTLTIKAYIDKDTIGISDTYQNNTNQGSGSDEWANGREIFTTEEWNSISESNSLSFRVKAVAQEGIWVNPSLRETIVMMAGDNEVTDNSFFQQTAEQQGTDSYGVYKLSTPGNINEENPIYFFRGDHSVKNNVIFNGFCWKAVRTTELGGTRLIYNGVPGEVIPKVALSEDDYTVVTNTANFTFDETDNSWNATLTNNSSDNRSEISFTVPAGDDYQILINGKASMSGGSWYYYKDGTQVSGGGNGGGSPNNYDYTYGTLTSTNVIKLEIGMNATEEDPAVFKIQMVGRFGESLGIGCDNTGNATMISMYENQTIVDDNYQYSYTAKDGYTLKTGDSFKFNVNYNNAKYVGYKYQTTTENDTNSNIKNILDAWYEGAITVSNRDKVEDSIYCNDRSIGHTSGSITYYGGYDRAEAGTPSVVCPNASDSFTVSGGLSDNPVGFLTIDEVALAGRTWLNGMQDYLYNASYYWLGSPYGFRGSYASEFHVGSAYGLNSSGSVVSASGVRPAVSIKANTSYVSGDGSAISPFYVS